MRKECIWKKIQLRFGGISVRQCCKDCIFFIQLQKGQRGGVKGKCRIRRPNEQRVGSATACRMFGRAQKN